MTGFPVKRRFLTACRELLRRTGHKPSAIVCGIDLYEDWLDELESRQVVSSGEGATAGATYTPWKRSDQQYYSGIPVLSDPRLSRDALKVESCNHDWNLITGCCDECGLDKAIATQ